MPQPTARTLLLLAASLPLSFAPVVLGPASWVLGAAAVAALLVVWLVDLFKSADARDWRVTADVPPTLFIGDADPLPISVALAHPERARDVRLRVDLGARFEPVASVALELDAKGNQSLDVPLSPHG